LETTGTPLYPTSSLERPTNFFFVKEKREKRSDASKCFVSSLSRFSLEMVAPMIKPSSWLEASSKESTLGAHLVFDVPSRALRPGLEHVVRPHFFPTPFCGRGPRERPAGLALFFFFVQHLFFFPLFSITLVAHFGGVWALDVYANFVPPLEGHGTSVKDFVFSSFSHPPFFTDQLSVISF